MKVKLGEIAVLINGDRGKNYPSQADIVPDGDVPFVNAGHLNGRNISFDDMNYISQQKYDQLNSGKFCEGDILYCLRGSLGKKATVKDDIQGAIASSLVIIRPNSEKVDVDYLMFALDSSSIQEQLVKANNGSSQPNLSAANVRAYDIDLPEKKIQEAVVARLNKIRIILDARQQELQKLDDLIKARFVEMFGDLSNPECLWDKYKLIDVCVEKDDIKCGPFGTQLSKDEYTKSGIAVWEIPQINAAFLSKPTHFLTKEKAEQLKAYTIISGDIAMSRKGNVGKCALFPENYPSGIIHSDVLRIRVNQKRVTPVFMMCQLHFSSAVKRQIELVSSGAIMAGVNVTKLKQIYVQIPPMELQEQFAAFVYQVNKSKVAVQKALDETQTLFDSLMQEYFG